MVVVLQAAPAPRNDTSVSSTKSVQSSRPDSGFASFFASARNESQCESRQSAADSAPPSSQGEVVPGEKASAEEPHRRTSTKPGSCKEQRTDPHAALAGCPVPLATPPSIPTSDVALPIPGTELQARPAVENVSDPLSVTDVSGNSDSHSAVPTSFPDSVSVAPADSSVSSPQSMPGTLQESPDVGTRHTASDKTAVMQTATAVQASESGPRSNRSSERADIATATLPADHSVKKSSENAESPALVEKSSENVESPGLVKKSSEKVESPGQNVPIVLDSSFTNAPLEDRSVPLQGPFSVRVKSEWSKLQRAHPGPDKIAANDVQPSTEVSLSEKASPAVNSRVPAPGASNPEPTHKDATNIKVKDSQTESESAHTGIPSATSAALHPPEKAPTTNSPLIPNNTVAAPLHPAANSPESAVSSPDLSTAATAQDAKSPSASGTGEVPRLVSPIVHNVQLLDRSGQAEMHIGLHTAAFGSVEVHAVVRDSQVGLAIGSERGDLHRFLANEVPGISGRLEQHDLRLDTVRFFDQGLSFDAGLASGSNPKAREFFPARAAALNSTNSTETTTVHYEPEMLSNKRTGLNVRA